MFFRNMLVMLICLFIRTLSPSVSANLFIMSRWNVMWSRGDNIVVMQSVVV
jgi:hypothetical protein